MKGVLRDRALTSPLSDMALGTKFQRLIGERDPAIAAATYRLEYQSSILLRLRNLHVCQCLTCQFHSSCTPFVDIDAVKRRSCSQAYRLQSHDAD